LIATFNNDGTLPPGIHAATWDELDRMFGFNWYRKKLLRGMRMALENLKKAGCKTVYIDGSFVTLKNRPKDYDGCWDPDGVNGNLLDPVLLDFSNGRAKQKAKYFGELFIASRTNGSSGQTFLEFFQNDKETGKKKGVVLIDLERFS